MWHGALVVIMRHFKMIMQFRVTHAVSKYILVGWHGRTVNIVEITTLSTGPPRSNWPSGHHAIRNCLQHWHKDSRVNNCDGLSMNSFELPSLFSRGESNHRRQTHTDLHFRPALLDLDHRSVGELGQFPLKRGQHWLMKCHLPLHHLVVRGWENLPPVLPEGSLDFCDFYQHELSSCFSLGPELWAGEEGAVVEAAACCSMSLLGGRPFSTTRRWW